MTWVRLDDLFSMHRKVRQLSDAAFRLHISAMCYSAHNETNGHILDGDLPIISDVKKPVRAALELVERGLWEDTEIGWQIHDFLEYNPSADEVEQQREQRRQAGRLGGQRSGVTRRSKREANHEANASDSVKQTPSKREAKTNPVPVPDPGSSSSSLRNESSPSLPAQRTPEDDDWKTELQAELKAFYRCDYPTTWLNRLIEQVIGAREIEKPVAYVMAAVRADSQRFGPTPTPPRFNALDGITVGRSL